MTITYYLFVDNIRNVFETLRMNILEPGIKYMGVLHEQSELLPPYIVIVSIYKDQYLLNKVREELDNIGYDKSFKILKPLVNEIE
jgi:hypothetical protein